MASAATGARPLAVPNSTTSQHGQHLHPSSAGSLPPNTHSHRSSAASFDSRHTPTQGQDTMDTLELAPGLGLGPFKLGDSLWHVLDLLRSKKRDVPKVDVSWDPDNAPNTAVTVHAGPLALLFPSPSQRLSHIALAELAGSDVTLTYEGTVLSSPSRPLTRAGVAYALGPTFNDGSQRLAYPGLALEAAGGGRDDAVISVSVSAKDGEHAVGEDGLKEVLIQPGRGATLTFAHAVTITLSETTAQDVLLDLGPPLRKYWREDDRLDRVWGATRRIPPGHDATSPTACFWNYLQYGLDLLVVDGIVTKLIAYSNIPGTPMFQQYARCPWAVETDAGPLDLTAPLASFRAQLPATTTTAPPTIATRSAPIAAHSVPSTATEGAGAPVSTAAATETAGQGKKGKKKKGGGGGGGGSGQKADRDGDKDSEKDDSRVPTPAPGTPAHTRSATPATLQAHTEPDAMLLDRSVEGGLEGVVGLSRSQLIGLDGIVLEVDEGSGGIASVQIFKA